MEKGGRVRGKPRRAAAARLAGGVVLAGLILASLSACVLDTPYDKYAIVYGVADYQDGVNDLNYTDDDALAMEALLTGQGYQVVARRLNDAASKDNLQNFDIPAVAALAQQEDLFVFYFSGHGGQASSGSEAAGGDAYNEYIYLYGSDNLSNLSLAVSDDELVAAFAGIKARKKVIIIDACNSGGFIGNALEVDGEPPALVEGSDGLLERMADAIRLYANFDGSTADIPPSEALVLSASGEREFSYETPDSYGEGPPLYHGVFTYYLLEAERKGDLNHDGWVTVTEAFAYTQDMIYRYWNHGFPSDAFSPHVSGGPVDYVLFEAR
jgi:uncharacterized caspase-like protein